MSDGDAYVKITATLTRETQNAACLKKEGHDAEWVPRSVLSTASDLTIDRAAHGDEITVHVREWKAIELGWL